MVRAGPSERGTGERPPPERRHDPPPERRADPEPNGAPAPAPNGPPTPIISRVSGAERRSTGGAPANARRPSVDVVVPFAGSSSALRAVCERMGAIAAAPG